MEPEYYGFIKRKKVDELGIKIDELTTPEGIWDLQFPPEDAIVCYRGCPEFKKLESDPTYVKIKLSLL